MNQAAEPGRDATKGSPAVQLARITLDSEHGGRDPSVVQYLSPTKATQFDALCSWFSNRIKARTHLSLPFEHCDRSRHRVQPIEGTAATSVHWSIRRRVNKIVKELESTRRHVNVQVYIVRSLRDNFEWAFGYSRRFGIVWVDVPTGNRLTKASFDWYRNTIRLNLVEYATSVSDWKGANR
jgi:hypothetical protein